MSDLNCALGSGFVPIEDLSLPYCEPYTRFACDFQPDRPGAHTSFIERASDEYRVVDQRQRVSQCEMFMSDGGNYPGILPGDWLQ